MTSKDVDLSPHQVRALDELVAAGTLSAEQAAAVRAALRDAAVASVGKPRIVEVLGYAGGALVFGGTALLLGTTWEELTRAARVGIVSGVTVALVVAALVIAGGITGWSALRSAASSTRSRIVSVLLTVSAATAAIAAGSAGEFYPWTIGAAVGFCVAALAYVALPSILPLLGAGLLGWVAALGLLDAVEATSVRVTATLLPLALGWLVLSALGVIRHRAVGLAIGAALTLFAFQHLLGTPDAEVWAYGGTFVAAVGFIGWHLVSRDLVLLVAGIVGVTIAVPEAVWDLTDGAVGGAAIVIIAGFALLAASGAGLILRRRDTSAV